MGRSAEVAAVSGLLHDIGKVFRTGNKSHEEISAEIAGKTLSGTLPPDIVDEVCKLVRHHHAQAPPPGVDPVPFYAIKFADWAAANYREVDEVSSDRSPPPSYTVHSPFGYLTGSGDAPKWENAWGLSEDGLGDFLIRALSGRRNLSDVLLGLKTAIYSPPVFVIPDAVKDASIPLSVHLHLVSAIASALAASEPFRKAVKENMNGGVDAKILARRLASVEGDVIEFVAMDIHGIQRFIYTFTSERRAMRTAAGRSMIVSLLSRVIPVIVADVYGVYPTNVLINSGGRALLVLPAGKGIDVGELSERITESLWRQNVEVVVSLKSVPLSMSDFFSAISSTQEGDSEGRKKITQLFQRKLSELWKELRLDPFSVHLHGKLIEKFRSAPVSVAEGSNQICSRCGAVIQGSPYIEDGETICGACNAAVQVMSWWLSVLDSTGPAITPSVQLAVDAGEGEYTLVIRGSMNSIRLSGPSGTSVQLRVSGESDVLPDVPSPFVYRRNRDGHVLSLEEMGPFFAVAKGDGDSMGWIFHELLSQSLAKYVAFSWAISYYFEYLLPELLKKRADLQVHLVYAGGDDFLLVGKPSDVLEALYGTLAGFEEYKDTGKVSLNPPPFRSFRLPPSVSAGLALFPQKYKMLWAINYTEGLLHAAKHLTPKKQQGWCKGGLCVQSRNLVAHLSGLEGYIKTCREMLADLSDAGEVASTTFYKLVDRLYRILQASTGKRIGLPEVKLYSETKHYIHRLQKRIGGQAAYNAQRDHLPEVIRRADETLDAFLGYYLGGNTRDEIVNCFVPFVLTYLLLKGET